LKEKRLAAETMLHAQQNAERSATALLPFLLADFWGMQHLL
jgi:hypothetical protein